MNDESFTDMLDRYLDAKKDLDLIRNDGLPEIDRYKIQQRYEDSRCMLNLLFGRIARKMLSDE